MQALQTTHFLGTMLSGWKYLHFDEASFVEFVFDVHLLPAGLAPAGVSCVFSEGFLGGLRSDAGPYLG